jgi:hypothetical protein
MATATGQAAGLCTALAAHIGSESEVAATPYGDWVSSSRSRVRAFARRRDTLI